jgi:hypothetical protein
VAAMSSESQRSKCIAFQYHFSRVSRSTRETRTVQAGLEVRLLNSTSLVEIDKNKGIHD